MLVIVNRSASVHAAITGTGRFCLNLMGEIHAPILEQFSRSDMRHLRFKPADWEEDDGLPILKGALSSLICTVDTMSDYSTHTIFVGRVDRVILTHHPSRGPGPLVWMDGGSVSLAGKP
jgi:flavin reductase (DIM6/NTAB) family NADH-FMN oxidoreductase RutF